MNPLLDIEYQLRTLPRPYVTDAELKILLGGTADSRQGKVQRLVAAGKLVHVRRGLYCLTKRMGYPIQPHPFELAAQVYSPSYISLESALSYHGLTPEAVYTVTCVSIGRAKEFRTPFGVFSYRVVPEAYFYTEVSAVVENNYRFLMAKPWKAICDYVFCYKKDWYDVDPLINSLRIDLSDLPYLSDYEVNALDEYYHHTRVTRFLQGVKQSQFLLQQAL
jgi:hypothetical protein